MARPLRDPSLRTRKARNVKIDPRKTVLGIAMDAESVAAAGAAGECGS